MTAERKAFTPVIRGVSGDGKVTLVLATINQVDHDGDVTLPGFFGRQTAQVIPSHDWGHVPLGKTTIREEGAQAIAEITFNLKVPAAVDWYEAIRYDWENPPALQEYSYGFTILPGGSDRGQFNGRPVRFLQPLKNGRPGVDVHEVSPVLMGAGVGTRTLAVKHDPRRTASGGRGLNDAERAELDRIHIKLIADQVRADIATDELRAELTGIVDHAGIHHHYSETLRVPPGIRAAAKAAIDTYAPRLGLDPTRITVRWFSEELPDDGTGAFGPGYADFTSLQPLGGRCQPKLKPGEMWLHSGLDEADAWSIAAHELRHLADGDEDEAKTFEIMARLDRITNP